MPSNKWLLILIGILAGMYVIPMVRAKLGR